jgi:hypothetical protein
MSKALPITVGPVATPAAGVAAAAVMAVGAGAVWAAKKIYEQWASIPPEDRAYLLPFGAGGEHQKIERMTTHYAPMDGFEFNSAPGFGGTTGLPWVSHAVAKEPAFCRLEEEARQAGFEIKQRALPPGENVVIIIDLFEMDKAPEPAHMRRPNA